MTKARDLADASTALSAVSATELAFVDGVTSAIQTQMDAKAPSSTAVTLTGTQTLTNKTLTNPVIASVINNTLTSTTGDIIYASAANTPARLAAGTSGYVLTSGGAATAPSWAAASAPAFVGCSLWESDNVSAPNATLTTMTFDSELFDTNGFHSTATNKGRITIPAGKAGYYLLFGQITFLASGTGGREAGLYKNGSATALTVHGIKNTASTVNDNANVTSIQYLAVNDYVELRGWQDNGTALNMRGSVYYTSFMAQYLGA